MNQFLRRYALGMAAVVAVLLLFWLEQKPLEEAQSRREAWPMRGLQYASRAMELTPTELSIFGAAGVTKRWVQAREGAVICTIIDGTRNRHALHDPVLCFRGGGWTATGTGLLQLPGGQARWHEWRKGTEVAHSCHWFSSNQQRYPEAWRAWGQGAWRRLTRQGPEAEPLLIVLISLEQKRVDWKLILQQIPALTGL